eukprot:3408130-Prymnesium_polylepis.1
MTVASRLMCPSSLVFSRTSCRSPAESSSASAIFLRSACARARERRGRMHGGGVSVAGRKASPSAAHQTVPPRER